MVRAFLYAIVFVIVGGVVFSLAAPLVFPHANPEKLGETAMPIVALLCGAAGFVVGLRRHNRPNDDAK